MSGGRVQMIREGMDLVKRNSVNYLKINVLMQKLLLSLCFICGLFFIASTANAQFRKIPGVVTDSFKEKYPNAKSVSWKDNVTAFTASFTLDSDQYQAKYNSKGEWLQAEKKIKQEGVPAAVKDGLSKSKYADWKIGTVTERYLPGDKVEYIIGVSNGTLNKRVLTFNSDGQLQKDGITL